MKKEQIENYFSKLFKSKVSILILKNQLAKKWYDKSYLQTDSISENIIYGVSIDRVICFDVKVSKIDNIFKTILTNYISKVMTKQHRVINGSLGYLTKEQCYEELKLNATKISFTLLFMALGCLVYFITTKHYLR